MNFEPINHCGDVPQEILEMYPPSPFIMERSFAISMGFNWPHDLVAIVNGKRITIADVRRNRREQQKRRMAEILKYPEPSIVPCYVWTFLVPGWFKAGWYCYIVTRKEDFCIREDSRLAMNLMEEIHLGILPMQENFKRWMIELSRHYPRKHPHDPRKAGSIVGWYNYATKVFSLSKPSTVIK